MEEENLIGDKIQDYQKYIPTLEVLIKKFENDKEKLNELEKLKLFFDLLINQDKSIKLETILEYETILNKNMEEFKTVSPAPDLSTVQEIKLIGNNVDSVCENLGLEIDKNCETEIIESAAIEPEKDEDKTDEKVVPLDAFESDKQCIPAKDEANINKNNIESVEKDTNSAIDEANINKNDKESIEKDANSAIEEANINKNNIEPIEEDTNSAIDEANINKNDMESTEKDANSAIEEANINKNNIEPIEEDTNSAIDEANINKNNMESVEEGTNSAIDEANINKNNIEPIEEGTNSAIDEANINKNNMESTEKDTKSFITEENLNEELTGSFVKTILEIPEAEIKNINLIAEEDKLIPSIPNELTGSTSQLEKESKSNFIDDTKNTSENDKSELEKTLSPKIKDNFEKVELLLDKKNADLIENNTTEKSDEKTVENKNCITEIINEVCQNFIENNEKSEIHVSKDPLNVDSIDQKANSNDNNLETKEKNSEKDNEIIDLSLDDDYENKNIQNKKPIHVPEIDITKIPIKETESIKKIELPPLSLSDIPAVVYLIKDSTKTITETMVISDSDSDDDDDVILVSTDLTNKKPPLGNTKTVNKIKNHNINLRKKPTSEPMFLISSVQSINTGNKNITNVKKKSEQFKFHQNAFSLNINSANNKRNDSNKIIVKKSTTSTNLDSTRLILNVEKGTEFVRSKMNAIITDITQDIKIIDNFLINLFTLKQNQTTVRLSLLQKILEPTFYKNLKDTIEAEMIKMVSPNLDENLSDQQSDDTKLKLENLNKELHELLIKNDVLTSCGQNLLDQIKETGKSRKKRDRKQLWNKDNAYSPSKKISLTETPEKVSERRQLLQRQSKQKCKQYIAKHTNDDLLNLELNDIINRHNARQVKRSNDTPKSPILKKIKPNEIDCLLETDLLQPTWFEGDDDNTMDGNQLFNKTTNNELSTITSSVNEINTDSILKNINRAYHCRSPFVDSCLICNEKQNYVVSHYVNEHREFEVFISRLPQKDVDYIRMNMNFGYLIRSNPNTHINQYSAKCIFCQQDFNFVLRCWYEHYTMHSGEYTYQCSKCYLRRPRRRQIQRHVTQCQSNTDDAEIITLHDFDLKSQQINAYICIICNYIQLHKMNIISHLRLQHDLDIVNNLHYHKIILLRISRDNVTDRKAIEDYVNDGNSESMDCTGFHDYLLQRNSDTDFVQYPDDPSDDLSFTICGMLATNEETSEQDSILNPDINLSESIIKTNIDNDDDDDDKTNQQTNGDDIE